MWLPCCSPLWSTWIALYSWVDWLHKIILEHKAPTIQATGFEYICNLLTPYPQNHWNLSRLSSQSTLWLPEGYSVSSCGQYQVANSIAEKFWFLLCCTNSFLFRFSLQLWCLKCFDTVFFTSSSVHICWASNPYFFRKFSIIIVSSLKCFCSLPSLFWNDFAPARLSWPHLDFRFLSSNLLRY